MSLHKINNITVKLPINNQPILPVKGAALILERCLFQLWVKH